MVWTINLMYAVLLTSVTGAILFGFWYGIGCLLERIGFINVIYELLKAVLFFWYIPLAFLVVMYVNTCKILWGGFLCKITPHLLTFSKLFCMIWFFGVLLNIGCYLVELRSVNRRYRNAIPCDDWMYDYFEQICTELRIPIGKVELVQDSHDTIPKIVGAFHPKVVLPMRDYTRDELRVIFIHELTHYKQRALWLKHLTEIAIAFHFFNPCIWIFSRKVDYWGEYACDYEAISVHGNMKGYFEVIADMEINANKEDRLMSKLVKSKNDLVDRMKLMKKTYKIQRKSKLKAAALVAVMALASTCSVSAATVFAGNTYMNAYYATVVEKEDLTQYAGSYEEYEADGFEEGVTVTIGEVNTNARTEENPFKWTIAKNAATTTSTFSASSGQTIYVTVVATSSSATFRAGIIEPDGTLRYANSEDGVVYHAFELDQTGKYSVYVQNMGSSSITVNGSYIVR
jgi:beta-lactamase regulating signal transducer with metallopeptidase domain